MSAKERSPNRLISEASMYLRQHAHNPVDWFAWGQEALNKAKTEDKPIMLSIGYSACHWCHVMEKESFEDEATAILLNTGFVNIKVDREERPEIDQIYQTVVQLMGRSGGWPLTVFLTPDQKPFFAGTYFPPVRRYGMPAFSEILNAVRDAFDNRREEVEQQGHELAIAIAEVSDPASAKSRKNASVLFDSPTSRKHTILDQVAPHLWRRFDDAHGGFGTRPKFPNSMNLELLLRHSVVKGDNESAKKVIKALISMRRGGIWDHLGGGFHRYSTDEHWLVPHFEKMLYDNALLLRLYHDAARVFSDDSYLSVAKDIADYLLREMKSAGGAFYATQDADSEGEEGKFFVWTVEQICSEITDTIDQKIALSFFGVESGGNFEHTGATVLSQSCEEKELAEQLGLTANEVNSRLRAIRAKLFETREHREKPLRDEKMLACWNGLLIGALAELGATTRQEYVEAAKEAFAYIEQRLIEGGRVARYATETGYVAKPGFLDDHASIANAALDLYEVTGEPHYSEVAKQIADTILNRFTDNRGGFFVAADDHETLVCRIKDGYDSATPSGTSLALRLLRRLASLYGQPYADIVKTQATALSAAALESAMGFGQLLLELDLIERGPIDIVIVGNNPADFLRLALQQYLPERTIAWVDPNNNQTINAAPELTRDKTVANGTTGAFVCRDFACSKPVYSPAELSTLLKRLRQNQRTDDCFGAGQALSSKYPAEGIPRPWLNRDQ